MLETSEEGLSDNTVKDRVKFMVKRNCNAEGSFMVKAVCTFIFNPFNYILACIAIISLFIDAILVPSEEKDFSTCIIIAIMLLFSTILRFIQEFRSNKAAEALKMVKQAALPSGNLKTARR